MLLNKTSMRYLFLLFSVLAFSCVPKNPEIVPNEVPALQTPNKQAVATPEVAVRFINLYVQYCNTVMARPDLVKFAAETSLTTPAFQTTLKTMTEEAYQNDPELGFGADPFFDAQDYPDQGFELESFDDESKVVVVKGIGWPDFRLALRLAKVNEKWLVDGCGTVNMLESQRIVR